MDDSATGPAKVPLTGAESRALRWVVGFVCFGFASVVCGLAFGFAFGGLQPWNAWASLVIGAIIGAGAGFSIQGTPATQALRWWDGLLLTAFALASIRAFVWIIYWKGNDWMVLSPYNLGDLALHIGLIRYLASGVAFWPESLILADSSLVYPVGVDLFNSLLLRVGVPLEPGLIWVGLIGSALTAWALWIWGRGFAIAAFLFVGGLAGLDWIRDGYDGLGWALRDLGQDTEWKNLFLTMFVTQRGFLFALPAGLLLLHDWRLRIMGRPAAFPMVVAGLLYAAMPIFSVHAFLFLSLTLVAVFLAAPNGSVRLRFLLLGMLAVIPASVAVYLVTGGFAATGNLRWKPGWMQEDAPWTFWIWNFGVMIPLWGISVARAVFHRDRLAMAFAVPATAFFIACLLVSFAPWPWDNTKIMLWCWLAIVPCVWKYTIEPLPIWGRLPVFVCLFFTGVISLVGGLDGRHGYALARRDALETVAVLVQGLPPETRFASAPGYAHPLILQGRPVAIGYPGHLWSHGLKYEEKQASLNRLMRGDVGWQNDADVLGVDYLFWGPDEALAFPQSSKSWLNDPAARIKNGAWLTPLHETKTE